MKTPGDDVGRVMVAAQSALIDAVLALQDQKDALIVIGAQAVYLHTGRIDVALAETTKDSDVALDPGKLVDDPRIEAAMKGAGFLPAAQPGTWVRSDGIPVDLMVPESLSGTGSQRGGRIPPHSRKATRRARGLEAAVIDNEEHTVESLDPNDSRTVSVNVAGPAALLVAKLHKIGERVGQPHRLNDKDAHDAYRLLRAIETMRLAEAFGVLALHEVTQEVTREALAYLRNLFASGPGALGSMMAGRAEEGVGDPDQVSAAVTFLAQDLLDALFTQGFSFTPVN